MGTFSVSENGFPVTRRLCLELPRAAAAAAADRLDVKINEDSSKVLNVRNGLCIMWASNCHPHTASCAINVQFYAHCTLHLYNLQGGQKGMRK